ncbi:hypothetical protein PTTG_25213 [Puccinia triticina 1-1 BBBD Race 1]|uniref:Uncharacterized protein n=1 Tax=Puccinia triticina (isolate 1-1 / race 1 (BBBD)) TaxID=630390 RepID=A0A180H3I7_PUCT1|nr:hypothetical protein PTTG_25213 [Puccinia triticina 1-1 BBBD Race 1]
MSRSNFQQFRCILNHHDWIVSSSSELGRKAAILRVALCRQEKARDVQFPPAVTPPGTCHTIPAGASTSTISTPPLHARRALNCCSPHPGLAGLRTPKTANTCIKTKEEVINIPLSSEPVGGERSHSGMTKHRD